MISNIQNIKNQQGVKANFDAATKNEQVEKQNIKSSSSVDRFEKQIETSEVLTYAPPKKLDAEQLEALNEEKSKAQEEFISKMVQQNLEIQAGENTINHYGIELSETSASLLTDIFGSLDDALPPPATTKEGALENISEGGSYSVEAVAQRIMKMATTFANGSPEVLAEMKKAVQDGFAAAGFSVDDRTTMPEITGETYDYVMDEFSKLENSYE